MKSLTVSEAKPRLGRIVDRVIREGKPAIIRRKGGLVQIARHPAPEPIPVRPPGYFKLRKAEIDRINSAEEALPE
jgi:hypothetical protein